MLRSSRARRWSGFPESLRTTQQYPPVVHVLSIVSTRLPTPLSRRASQIPPHEGKLQRQKGQRSASCSDQTPLRNPKAAIQSSVSSPADSGDASRGAVILADHTAQYLPAPHRDARAGTRAARDLALYERLIEDGIAAADSRGSAIDHVIARGVAIWLITRPQQSDFNAGLIRFVACASCRADRRGPGSSGSGGTCQGRHRPGSGSPRLPRPLVTPGRRGRRPRVGRDYASRSANCCQHRPWRRALSGKHPHLRAVDGVESGGEALGVEVGAAAPDSAQRADRLGQRFWRGCHPPEDEPAAWARRPVQARHGRLEHGFGDEEPGEPDAVAGVVVVKGKDSCGRRRPRPWPRRRWLYQGHCRPWSGLSSSWSSVLSVTRSSVPCHTVHIRGTAGLSPGDPQWGTAGSTNSAFQCGRSGRGGRRRTVRGRGCGQSRTGWLG